MMRVPGTHGSPLEHKARGMDVRIVYSPSDALKLARINPDKHVMFFAIGFETTAPSTALTLMRAKAEGIRQFLGLLQSRHDHSRHPRDSRFARHAPRRFHRPRACLDRDRLPSLRVDRARRGQADRGLRLRAARHAAIDRHAAAPVARRAKPRWRTSTSAWCRGKAIARRCGPWPKFFSCVRISNGAAGIHLAIGAAHSNDKYAAWDAEQRFEVPGVRVTDPKAAQCGEVLKGVLKPHQCKLFGTECTPEHPVGALMVSSEGSCAAYYNYEHRKAAMATSLTSIA